MNLWAEKAEWPCPKCGCSHELEKGLHERWGCYRDTDAVAGKRPMTEDEISEHEGNIALEGDMGHGDL